MARSAVTCLAAFVLLIASPVSAEIVPITLLQINDVYEITPVQGRGGLARIAALKKRLLAENPRTYMLLAGDVLSPSALASALGEDRMPLAGRQIVDVMNVAGLDFAAFGNHEFDLSEAQFLARLAESKFHWIAANVRDVKGERFTGVPDNTIITVKGEGGSPVRIGIIGLTIDSSPRPWVTYLPALETARQRARQLRPHVDILVALTHLALDEDVRIAEEIAEIDLIIGGHEHENWEIRRGGNYTPITKADANGKTAFIHRIRYDTETKQLRIESVLEVVDGAIEEDSATAAVVDRWIDLAWRGFREAGFDAARPIATIPVALDGTAVVNNRPTNLTELIAAAMAREVPQGDLVVFNAGSIRIDDHLAPGVLTEYDVLRTLPFGGLILSVGMKGDLLERVLDQGMANRGSGGFLQTRNVERRDGSWWIGPERLSPDRVYTVAIADFLMTGRERGLSFLTRDHPSVVSVEAKGDVRKAVIAELQRRWGARDERRGARGERRGARDERRGTRDERLLKTWALTGE